MLISFVQGQTVLSKSACWQGLQTEVSPANSAIGLRLDGDWTPPLSPCPSEVRHFLPYSSSMGEGQRLREDGETKQLRCLTLLRDWTLWDRDWIAIGRRLGDPQAK